MLRGRYGNIIIIGFDKENINRLLNNEPIHFKTDDLDIPDMQVIILAGETLNEVKEDLRCMGIVG